MQKITLGHTYEDKITGFAGLATGHVEYLTGCSQVFLTPRVDAAGKTRDGGWFDAQRLELQEDGLKVDLDNSETPGFGDPAPAY